MMDPVEQLKEEYVRESETCVAITLGDGAELLITRGGELHLTKNSPRTDGISRINLGRATKRRFMDLREFVNQLSIHAVDA